MTINYGKRNLGAGTAVSPGDTLYIPLNFYNDSGASISIGNTLVAGDIEVFKDGGVAQRATDSGYAIMGDTGNFDNRIGFKIIKIQLYNTADDAAFYAVGSSYQVAIDSVTVDARTVRFWAAVFEIGEQRANIVQVNGDTGAADVLQKFAATGGTLSPTGELDTGSVANSSYLPANVIRMNSDTGAASVLQQFANTNGTLSPTGELDTGSVANNSYLPANTIRMSGDTGAADVLRQHAATNGALSPTGEFDTGTVANNSWLRANAALMAGDTGAADVLRQFAATNGTLSPTGELDTGSVANSSYLPANVIRWLGTAAVAPTLAGVPKVEVSTFADTGIQNRLDKIAADTDTGIQSSVNVTSIADTGINSRFSQVTAINVTGFADTGVNDRLAKILADTDTGIQSGVTVTGFADTGVNSRLAAITTKTDQLVFTVAGQVNANVQYVNDTQVTGTGASGDEWGPA